MVLSDLETDHPPEEERYSVVEFESIGSTSKQRLFRPLSFQCTQYHLIH